MKMALQTPAKKKRHQTQMTNHAMKLGGGVEAIFPCWWSNQKKGEKKGKKEKKNLHSAKRVPKPACEPT